MTCRALKVLWATGLGVLIMAAGPAGATTSADGVAKSSAHWPGVSFSTKHTTVWLGGTQLIAFSTDRKVEKTTQLSGSIRAGGQRLEIVRQPEVVKGFDLGFVRVRAKEVGEAILAVANARIKVKVKRSASHTKITRHRPRIVAPAPGAAVWGKIAVGVEVFDDVVQYPGKRRAISLKAPNGVTVKKLDSTGLDQGSSRLFSYSVDFSKCKPGAVSLIAVAQHPSTGAVVSRPVTISVVDPDDGKVIRGEAEGHQDLKRPDGFSNRPPRVGKDKHASGGKYVNNSSRRPAVLIPVKVHHAGWYQMVIRARGDIAGDDWPEVALHVAGDRQYKTGSPVIGEHWRRNPVGQPFHLDKGEHLLSPRFDNDFNRKPAGDRNLAIDAYELLRLDHRPPLGNPAVAKVDAIAKAGAQNDAAAIAHAPAQSLNAYRPIVAIDQNLHRRTLSGDLTVDGHLHWPGGPADPPTVTLTIDGKAVMSQVSGQPHFKVNRGYFKPGQKQTIELIAKCGDGLIGKSAPLSVSMSGAKLGQSQSAKGGAKQGAKWSAKPRDYHRFTVADKHWAKAVRENLSKDKRSHGDRVRSFYSNNSADLALPEDLRGQYAIKLEARGDKYNGPPVARISLVVDRQAKALKDVKVVGNYRRLEAGKVDLPKGPKRLRVAFINDDYGGSAKEDRNLYLRALTLRKTADKDEVKPAAKIVYPKAGASVHGVDAVVARVCDNVAVNWLELMIDGKPTGVRLEADDGLSRKLLPLALRYVEPGRHRLSVRVADEAGNVGHSEPIGITVRGSASGTVGPYKQAVRLLRRFGYGPEPAQLAAVLSMGEQAYLKSQLGHTLANPGEANAWAGAVVSLPNTRSGYQVKSRAIGYLLTTPNPIRARLLMFVDNHFSTWIRKARPWREARDFASFVNLGPAPFGDLLASSSTSPAMLRFLDQYRSYKGRVNENYAREVMELHTLGVDAGYTQHDVIENTHLLTGWSYTDHARLDGGGQYQRSSFRFLPPLNDPRARTVFGLRLPKAPLKKRFDRIALMREMLTAHPSTARFICGKLIDAYVADPPPAHLLDRLIQRFTESGGDLAAVMSDLAKSPAVRGRRIKPRLSHPVSYAVSLIRGTSAGSGWRVYKFLQSSGIGIFGRRTPDGFPPEDPAYADTNAMLQRWRLARAIDWQLSRSLAYPLRHEPDDADHKQAKRWAQRVIDQYAIRITGYTLSKASNEAALAVLQKTKGSSNTRLRTIATFIAQLPEANLR